MSLSLLSSIILHRNHPILLLLCRAGIKALRGGIQLVVLHFVLPVFWSKSLPLAEPIPNLPADTCSTGAYLCVVTKITHLVFPLGCRNCEEKNYLFTASSKTATWQRPPALILRYEGRELAAFFPPQHANSGLFLFCSAAGPCSEVKP